MNQRSSFSDVEISNLVNDRQFSRVVEKVQRFKSLNAEISSLRQAYQFLVDEVRKSKVENSVLSDLTDSLDAQEILEIEVSLLEKYGLKSGLNSNDSSNEEDIEK